MNKCPHCSREAMSLWQKSALGPGRTVGCKSCGKPVAAHWAAIFAAIPAFLGGLAMMEMESRSIAGLAVVAGVVTMGVLHTFLVPLVRSDA